MLESPLKKNKHSYPIDFSSKRKEVQTKSPIKYDIINFDDANPQKKIQQKNSVALSGSFVSQLFLQTNKKPQKKNDSEFITSRQANTQSSNPQQKHVFHIQFAKDNLNFTQNEQPLKEIRRKNNKIIIDQNKLKNPKIQINEQLAIVTNQMTLEPFSPQKLQSSQKLNLIGSIRRQDFQYLQQFQNEKQIPLHPQKPFNLITKNMRRNSFLQKLNLSKTERKSQQFKKNQSFQNSPQKKIFHPQNYTYANRLLASSEEKFQKSDKIIRTSSFQQTKKKDNITFVNDKNIGSLSFNLKNIPLIKDLSHKKSNHQDFLPFKAKSPINSFFPINTNDFFTKSQEQSKILFQQNHINTLKNQINLIAKNRLKNRSDQSAKINQIQRQFTFQEPQKKKQVIKGHNDFGKLKQVIKKPTKKLQITYHVPLAKLKGLCRTYLASPNFFSLAFKVPKIFMQEDLFRKNQSKEDVHENGLFLFQSLRINPKQMVIKRYSNCLMFICGNIVVIWYYSGKRYLGGWQYEYLDQGSRHGLGLQWQPDVFIYYGQFKNNKRHGIGMMKQGPQKVTVGYWNEGKYRGTNYKQSQQPQFDQNYNAQIQEQTTQNDQFSDERYYEYDER